MSDKRTWLLLFVDDDDEICRQAREFFNEKTIDTNSQLQIETLNSFDQTLDKLESRRVDLVILDVRVGSHDDTPEEEAGIKTLEAIQQKRFLPIIFYTGLPNLVSDQATALVRVVEKTEGLSQLLNVIKEIFATRLPDVNRALIGHLERVQCDYMWSFVATHWDKFDGTPDRSSLAYLLAIRLARSLLGIGIHQLAQDLGDSAPLAMSDNCIHPMQYYLLPPVERSPLAGDIYQGQIGERTGYWILLTPSCDMVIGRVKAENVLFANCFPLAEQPEYESWSEGLPQPSSGTTKALKALLQNNRRDRQAERFFYLPGALTLPDLIVDFQELTTLALQQMDSLERLASLDSPFAESLMARFARYFGRLGTPDLDVDHMLSRIQSRLKDT